MPIPCQAGKDWFFPPLSMPSRWIAAVLGFGFFFLSLNYVVHRGWDFSVYYVAAKSTAEGENPYDVEVLQKTAEQITESDYGGLPFFYFPFFNRLLSPFTFFTHFQACFLWFVLKCVALEISLFAILCLLGIPVSPFSIALLHGLAYYYRPFSLDFNTGNIAIFEMAFLLVFFVAWRKKRYWSASLLLILSAIPKGLTLLLGLYPYHLKSKPLLRSLGWGVGIFVIFLVVDWEMTSHWLSFYQSQEWKMLWDDKVQSFYNCSSVTALLHIFTETYYTQPLIHAPLLATILIPLFPMAIVGMIAYGVEYRRKMPGFFPSDPITVALLLSGFLLLPPRLADYSLSLGFFAFCTVGFYSFKKRAFWPASFGMLGLLLIQIHLPPEHVPSGIFQLFIDKNFFGQVFLCLSCFLMSLRRDSFESLEYNKVKSKCADNG